MLESPRHLKPYAPDRPVIFMHVPKCAGTSFIRLLRRWFREGYRHAHQNEARDIMLPRVDVKLADGAWDPTVQCIHSHFDHGRGYGLPYHYPDVDQYFALMRDPYDMIVSMYFFAKGRSQRGEFRYRGKCVDIRERYPSVVDYLRAEQPWVENHLPVDLSPENCEEYVADRFVYLGLFEQLQESVDHLAFVLGKRKQELPRQNVSTYDEEIPEDLRDQIYERYPKAKALHDLSQQTYRVPNFDRDAILPPLGSARRQPSGNPLLNGPVWLLRKLRFRRTDNRIR